MVARNASILHALLLVLVVAGLSGASGAVDEDREPWSASRDAHTHRCAQASYLDTAAHDRLASQLNGTQQARVSEGWSTNPWAGPAAGRFRRSSGVSVWCSANQVKPPQCQGDMWASNGDTLPAQRSQGHYGFPVRGVYGSTLEFVHNYKAAGTAIMQYLDCQYGRSQPDADFAVSAFAVRDPIERFISGVGEILNRVINNVCPEGPCPVQRGWTAGMMLQTSQWYRLAYKLNFNFTDESVLPYAAHADSPPPSSLHATPLKDQHSSLS